MTTVTARQIERRQNNSFLVSSSFIAKPFKDNIFNQITSLRFTCLPDRQVKTETLPGKNLLFVLEIIHNNISGC